MIEYFSAEPDRNAVFRMAVKSIYLLVLIILVVLVFSPGRNGPWLFDDKHNIVNLQNLQTDFLQQKPLWRGAQVNDEWQRRSLARLSFAATIVTCGNTAACFKTTNIILQALTAVAAWFLFLQLLLRSSDKIQLKNTHSLYLIAFTASCLWALHPIQVSTVLYAVQRMTILSTLFSVLALNFYLLWRVHPQCWRRAYWLFAALIAWLCAYHSKENAVILPLLIMCIELFLLRPQLSARQTRRFYFCLTALLLGGLAVGIYFVGSTGFSEPYANRPFSPWERLLSEARVLWHYLYWIFLPQTSHYTLFHDDIAISRSLVEPLSTLFAIFSLGIISALCWYFRKRVPWLAFAWFWFLFAHAVESSFLNLELVFEHRNHLPLLGFCLAFVLGVFQLFKLTSSGNGQSLAVVASVAVLIYCAAITAEKSTQWRSDGSMLIYESQFHPGSVRLNYKIAFLWLQLAEAEGISQVQRSELIREAEKAMRLATQADSWSVHGYVGLIYMQSQALIESDAALWDPLYKRLAGAPPTADEANVLKVLTDCYLAGRCKLDKDRLEHAYTLYLQRKVKASARSNAEQMLLRLQLAN